MSTNRFRVTYHGLTIEQYDEQGRLTEFARDLGYQWDNMRRDQVNFVQAVDLESRTKLTEAGLAHEDAMRHPVMEPVAEKAKGKK